MSVRYRVRLPAPHTHLVHVEMEMDGVHDAARLVMPSWTPGSYLLREFPRNVQQFGATDGAGRPLAWERADKNGWRVEAPADGVLRVAYVVYANELTVRTSHVDASHACLNGASVFLYLDGRQHEPVDLEIEAPDGWHATTSLPDGPRPMTFTAADYDELVDSPVEVGTHAVLSWEIDGVPHRWVLWGRGNWDARRLVDDTTRMVRAARELWGGALPYRSYTFMVHLAPGGSGGLEHRESTLLLADRWAFRGPAYESFLALVAHEHFHAWNGKRLRPAVLGPFDYTREAYTRDLWVVEGFTTYYTDLVMRRAGLMTPPRYLERLSDQISRWRQLPGRHLQTLADSSFDTWIKFYRPDANTSNAQVSYYQKGTLVALLLDLTIRAETDGARSLDDVLLAMWERFGAPDVGFPEGEVERVAAEVAGIDLSARLDRWLRSTDELELEEALGRFGMVLAPAPLPGMGGAVAAGGMAAAGGAPASAGGATGASGTPVASETALASGAAAAGTAPSAGAGTVAMPAPRTGPTSTPNPAAASAPAQTPAGAAQTPSAPRGEPNSGINFKMEGGRVVVGSVVAGSPAYRAGVNAGDELVAIDGFRATPDVLAGRLGDAAPGSHLPLLVFRRDELVHLMLPAEHGPPTRVRISPAPGATEPQLRAMAAWLHAPLAAGPGAAAPAAG